MSTHKKSEKKKCIFCEGKGKITYDCPACKGTGIKQLIKKFNKKEFIKLAKKVAKTYET